MHITKYDAGLYLIVEFKVSPHYYFKLTEVLTNSKSVQFIYVYDIEKEYLHIEYKY